MPKATNMLVEDRLNELIGPFTQLNKGNKVNKTEIEEKNSVSKDNARNTLHTGKLTTHECTEGRHTIRRSRKRTNDKCECNGKTQNQETIVTTRSERRIRKPDRPFISRTQQHASSGHIYTNV